MYGERYSMIVPRQLLAYACHNCFTVGCTSTVIVSGANVTVSGVINIRPDRSSTELNQHMLDVRELGKLWQVLNA